MNEGSYPRIDAMQGGLDAIREYWKSPTGVDRAPPGMVELARMNVNQLADEIERLRAIVEAAGLAP